MTDSLSIIDPRKIHSTGHVDLCYIPNDRQLLTCGTDGDVHIYSKCTDEKTDSFSAGDCVYAIASLKLSFFAIGDDNKVNQYSIETGEYEKTLARLVAQGTHLVLNSPGTYLYFGCCDFEIRSVEICSGKLKQYSGHQAPILSVAVDKHDKYMASSSCDGTVKLWQLDEGIELKTLEDVLKPSNDFSESESLCRINFGGNYHEFLAIPIKQGEVEVYSVPDCILLYALEDPLVDETLSLACFSHCNDYLASGGVKGRILVWHIPTRKIHFSKTLTSNKTSITAMAFCPKNNELTFCDTSGKISALIDVLPVNDSVFYSNPMEDDIESDQEDLFDDANDLEALMESGAINDSITTNQIADSDNDTNDEFSINKLKQEYSDIRIQEGEESNDKTESQTIKPEVTVAKIPPPASMIKLQPAFQPSSSPEHLSHRFMVWNDIGAILQYNNEEENSIVVEFHDTATHHTLHIVNSSSGYTMASLSPTSLVLASPGISDQDDYADFNTQDTSVLYCHHFASSEDNKEWTIQMPNNEKIEAIAVGRAQIAVVTSNRIVRTFSVQGSQLDTFDLCGEVVSMSISSSPYSRAAHLMIIYHSGPGLSGDQCLGVKFLNLERCMLHKNRSLKSIETLSADRIPLSPKSTLQWLGFSIEGSPFYCDSCGIVRILNQSLGNNWTQVANIKSLCKGKSDNYFIIGINECPQQLRAVLCKGATFPMILPRPSVSLLSFKLPLCEIKSEKSQMEEKLLRSTLFSDRMITLTKQGESVDQNIIQESLIEQQETLMKLFALACKSSRDSRAIELATRMSSSSTVQLAIRYVTNLRPSNSAHISKCLSEIARNKLVSEEGLEEHETDEDEEVLQKIDVVSNEISNNFSVDRFENLDENDSNEENLKPKPSKMVKLKVKKRKEESDKKQFLCSDNRQNPFKISQVPENHTSRGSSVFDDMKIPIKIDAKRQNIKDKMVKTTEANIITPKKQSKIFGVSKLSSDNNENKQKSIKKTTAFNLWYDENINEYKDIEDSTLKAAKDFKNLSSEIKKEWVNKALEINSNSPEIKKRKLNSSSESSMQKLAKFAK